MLVGYGGAVHRFVQAGERQGYTGDCFILGESENSNSQLDQLGLNPVKTGPLRILRNVGRCSKGRKGKKVRTTEREEEEDVGREKGGRGKRMNWSVKRGGETRLCGERKGERVEGERGREVTRPETYSKRLERLNCLLCMRKVCMSLEYLSLSFLFSEILQYVFCTNPAYRNISVFHCVPTRTASYTKRLKLDIEISFL